MAFLAIVVLLISLFIGYNALLKMATALGQRNFGVLVLWQAIFMFVILQLTCTLRPLSVLYDKFMHFEKKRFFVAHRLEGGK